MPHRSHVLTVSLLPLSLLGLRTEACGDPACSGDSDGDGVCDEADTCPGSDDTLDQDSDGAPDGCDACPTSVNGDTNGDGVCDGANVAALTGMPRSFAVVQRQGDAAALSVAGTVTAAGWETIELEVLRNGAPFATAAYALGGLGEQVPFELEVTLPAGFFDYDLHLRLTAPGEIMDVASRYDVAVGELVLIQGQSNAVAADYHGEGTANLPQSHWIRSFGSASTDPTTAGADLDWGVADGLLANSHATVGAWGLRMGAHLMDTLGMPVGILNGAVGGTSVTQHQRNDANPEDLATIYGRFLYRARRASMDQGARIMVWYQGESDGSGWGAGSLADLYAENFAAMRADWAEDLPALTDVYVFQVRNGCGLDHPADATVFLDFRDAAGVSVGMNSYSLWTHGAWARYTVEGEAPTGAVTAWPIVTGVAAGAVVFDDGEASRDGGAQLLANPGFETGGPLLPDGWSYYGNGQYSWLTSNPHGGARALSLQSGSASAMAYQTFPAAPGEGWSFSIWARAGSNTTWYDVREALRSLPDEHADVTVLATNGAPGHDGCHFFTEGYTVLADQLAQVVLARNFGLGEEQLPPAPLSARFTGSTTVELTLDHGGSELTVEPGAEKHFRVAGAFVESARVLSPRALSLTLSAPPSAPTLAFSDDPGESADVRSDNGAGLLSFTDLLID